MIFINSRKEIATKNIKVYKVFKKEKNIIRLPFKKINSGRLNSLRFVIETASENPGYHCFESYELAEEYIEKIRNINTYKWICKYLVILELEIPKGTEYTTGTIDHPYIGHGLQSIATQKLTNPKLMRKILNITYKEEEIKL